jgi:hypothetical protein
MFWTLRKENRPMRPVVKRVLASVVAVLFLIVAAVGMGRVVFERRMDEELAALLAASGAPTPRIVTDDDLAGLPDPVQRWLHWAQVVGKPIPATVRLTQEGRFLQAEGRAWMPFTAEEYFTTDPPGFVWKATMRMAPGLSIVGRDAYVAGQGSIDMRLLGLVPVAQASGQELDQGALLRYLNEIMWFPAAALSPSITWEPIDADSARATMRHGGATGEAIFYFDDMGRPTDMVAERPDMARGRLETWSTPLHDHGEFQGVRVPVAGQGVWCYATGDFPYIELRITGLEFDGPRP